MSVFRIEMLPITFTRGLVIPARLRLLRNDSPLDLRSEARLASPFWGHFKDCAFTRTEMRVAIQRCGTISNKQKAALAKSVDSFTQVPDRVGDSFKRLFDAFEQVTMGICHDRACAEVGCKHAHAYRQATVITGTMFRTVQEARAWIKNSPGIVSGQNAVALNHRLRDWPGMPETIASATEATMNI